jgi:hypothetical protein
MRRIHLQTSVDSWRINSGANAPAYYQRPVDNTNGTPEMRKPAAGHSGLYVIIGS